MYYVRRNGIQHGNPISVPFLNSVYLPDSLISEYIKTRGFCSFDIDENDTIIAITPNQEALNEYLASHPDVEPEKPTTIDDLKKENKLLKAQLKAQTERSDFIEDCIAEMAGVVYNTEETTT